MTYDDAIIVILGSVKDSYAINGGQTQSYKLVYGIKKNKDELY